jgi:hypothetical protein
MFKNYNVGTLVGLQGDNVMQKFANWVNDPTLNCDESLYFTDLQNGTLPQVSFSTCGLLNDEHPPEIVTMGMKTRQKLINALMNSTAWACSAYLLTYGEGGASSITSRRRYSMRVAPAFGCRCWLFPLTPATATRKARYTSTVPS